MSRAPAEKVTGEVTVAPLPGEQILTVLSTVAVQTAEATFAEAKRRVAARKARREITGAPFQNKRLRIAESTYHYEGGSGRLTDDIAPPAQAQIVP